MSITLITHDNRETENPTHDQIAETVRALAVDEFAVLQSEEDEVYMQTMFIPEGYYLLEYRDGSEDKHYAIKAGVPATDDVIKTMQSYADGTEAWKDHPWEQLAFDEDDFVDED